MIRRYLVRDRLVCSGKPVKFIFLYRETLVFLQSHYGVLYYIFALHSSNNNTTLQIPSRYLDIMNL